MRTGLPPLESALIGPYPLYFSSTTAPAAISYPLPPHAPEVSHERDFNGNGWEVPMSTTDHGLGSGKEAEVPSLHSGGSAGALPPHLLAANNGNGYHHHHSPSFPATESSLQRYPQHQQQMSLPPHLKTPSTTIHELAMKLAVEASMAESEYVRQLESAKQVGSSFISSHTASQVSLLPFQRIYMFEQQLLATNALCIMCKSEAVGSPIPTLPSNHPS